VSRTAPILAVILCAAGCGGGTASSGTARVLLTDPGSADTVRFTVPVTTRRCGDDRGLLFIGAQHGQGVLVWLRDTAAPVVGAFPLLPRADSASVRGATVSIRFVTGALAHGVTVDDGSATFSRTGAHLGLTIRGRGKEPTIGVPHEAAIDLSDVPLEADTASCHVMP
jgi:hypothetical protein